MKLHVPHAHAVATSVAVILSSAWFSTCVAGDIIFERITDGIAWDVSDDGSIVVGADIASGGFIWTIDGTTSIGQVAGIAASADGSLIAGDTTGPVGNSAGRFDGVSWTTFGPLGASGCGSDLSSAYDISDDGGRAVGLGWDGCSARAFLWSPTEGMTAMPQSGPFSSRANTITGDGTVIGGWDEANNGTRRAAIWRENTKTGAWTESLPLTGQPGNLQGYGEVSGSNSDGSIIVGLATGDTDDSSGAFILRDSKNLDLVGLLPPQAQPVVGGLIDTTEDGDVMVGFQREGFGGFQRFRATIWTPDAGYQELKPYLNALGANIPDTFTLAVANSISDDGRVICGWGYEDVFFFQEAWVVVLPGADTPCPADLNGDGIVDGGDLGLLLAAWGTADEIADIDGSGDVNGADLGLILAAWGACA